jgi:hypothetical protein
MMRMWFLAVMLALFPAASLLAQSPTLQFDTVYECPAVQARMTVYSCAGSAPGDSCDLRTEPSNRPPMRGRAPRQQVMTLLQMCHVQTEAEARAAAQGGPPRAATPNRAIARAGGFKVGDKVTIATAGNWVYAKILEVRVDGSYMVQVLDNGPIVPRSYPAEVRRIGKLTDEDHLNGQYDLGDDVQVNVGGSWLAGRISGYTGTGSFSVRLPDERIVDTNLQNLRPYHPPAEAQNAPAGQAQAAVASQGQLHLGQPPKPGLTSCAGKFEGRYASAAGGGGLTTIVFRSGKATVRTPDVVMTDGKMSAMSSEQEAECWTGSGKIYLRWLDGSNFDFPIEINDDGTLDTPYGELKKKSK